MKLATMERFGRQNGAWAKWFVYRAAAEANRDLLSGRHYAVMISLEPFTTSR